MAQNKEDKTVEQLQDEYSYKTLVNFEGNEDVEAFYGGVEDIYRDEDGEIVVSLRDMENNVWDVSWEEIKNSEFDWYEDHV